MTMHDMGEPRGRDTTRVNESCPLSAAIDAVLRA
jgi:hypothetical protein